MTLRTKQTIRWIAAVLLYYSGIIALYDHFRSKGVLILCFHRVGEEGRNSCEMSMPPGFLDRQLSLLAARRPIIPLSEALEQLGKGDDAAKPATVITFDDGYADNYSRALPVLRDHKAPASFFLTASLIGSGKNLWYDRIRGIVLSAASSLPDRIRIRAGRRILAGDGSSGPQGMTDTLVEDCMGLDLRFRESAIAHLAEKLGVEESFLGEDRLLTWEEARALAGEGGEIGSHGCSHTTLSAAEDEEEELVESKRILEEGLGDEIRFFAYPNGKAGDFRPSSAEALRKAGYRCGLTTIEGENLPGCDPYTLKRKCLDYDDCVSPFGGFSPALFLCETGGLLRRLSWWKREKPRGFAAAFLFKVSRRVSRLFIRSIEHTLAEVDLGGLDAAGLKRTFTDPAISLGEIGPSDLAAIGASFGRKTAAEFSERLSRSRGFLASVEGKAVAYSWFTGAPREQEGDPPFLVPIIPRKGTVYFYDLHVAPSHRKGGIGTKLMAYRLFRALEAGASKALLIYSNPAIHHITGRFGFRDVGRLRYRRVLFRARRDVEDLKLVNDDA